MQISNNTLTLLLFIVLILALFPPLVNYTLNTLPFALLRYLFPFTSPASSGTTTTTSSTSRAPPTTPTPTSPNMSFTQKAFTLPPKSRGSYLITSHITSALEPELSQYKVGLLHLFVQHTSCALSLNENFDEDVRADMSDALDRVVPEDDGKSRKGLYRHDAEGRDDMPAHVKSSLIGAGITVPITQGRLNTGTWQGIWYLEFRAGKHARKVVATMQGEKF